MPIVNEASNIGAAQDMTGTGFDVTGRWELVQPSEENKVTTLDRW